MSPRRSVGTRLPRMSSSTTTSLSKMSSSSSLAVSLSLTTPPPVPPSFPMKKRGILYFDFVAITQGFHVYCDVSP
ncbi:hypothetical protein LINGRAHAP2_LOCUS25632 [Linum grandiflorum]